VILIHVKMVELVLINWENMNVFVCLVNSKEIKIKKLLIIIKVILEIIVKLELIKN